MSLLPEIVKILNTSHVFMFIPMVEYVVPRNDTGTITRLIFMRRGIPYPSVHIISYSIHNSLVKAFSHSLCKQACGHYMDIPTMTGTGLSISNHVIIGIRNNNVVNIAICVAVSFNYRASSEMSSNYEAYVHVNDFDHEN